MTRKCCILVMSFFGKYFLNVIINRVSRKKAGLPDFNGGTIGIVQNKKGGHQINGTQELIKSYRVEVKRVLFW